MGESSVVVESDLVDQMMCSNPPIEGFHWDLATKAHKNLQDDFLDEGRKQLQVC